MVRLSRVIVIPSLVILSPSPVILSKAKDLQLPVKINSAKDLRISFRVSRRKHGRRCENRKLPRSFVVPIQSIGTPQDDKAP